jgi:hypothetical protein
MFWIQGVKGRGPFVGVTQAAENTSLDRTRERNVLLSWDVEYWLEHR